MKKRQQLGLSSIELMIAMMIGIFLSVGTATLYFSSQRALLSQSQSSIIDDNGRLALQVLTEIVEHTGYVSTNGSPLAGEERFITSAVMATNCGGQSNVLTPALFATTANNTSGDSIGIVYIGDDSLNRDCSGAQLPAACRVGGVGTLNASKIYNYFSIGTNAEGIPVLNCAGSRSTVTLEIAEGVENLQVLYGVDDDNDNQVDKYINADQVTTWGRVISVQLAILVRSLSPVKNQNEPKTYTLLDNSTISTNDKFQRAIFSTIVRLRNVQL